MYLPQGTELHSRYVIESLLGHGGFGITYAAHDKLLNVRVAIKEYLPRQLATRGEGRTKVSIFTGEARQQYDYGLRKFLEEAQSVARFAHHPNVVSARDYFEANGTAYMVMEYVEGVTLKEYLEKKGGRIAFEEAKGIMMPVMDALREVHQAGMLHRDVSPDNIYITTSAQVKILDFGAARYFAGEQSKSLSVILKPGYAPEEQYRSSGKQGSWTDVYAVGATIYKALTGKTPPDALDRKEEDTLEPPSRLGVNIPPPAEQALLQALAVNAGQRLQTMGEFQQALSGGEPMTMGFQPAPAPFQPAPEPSHTPGATPVSAQPRPSVYPLPAAPPSHYPQAPRRSTNPAAIAAGIGAGVLGLVLLVVLIWRLVAVTPPNGDVTPPEKTRFTKAKDGVISDRETGLEWYVGPDRDTTWNEAKSWTESLTAAGGGWRMPTVPELKTLLQKGVGPNNMDPIFQSTAWWVWSGQLRDASSAWRFVFRSGQEDWILLGYAYNPRAFAVRSRQRSEVRVQEEEVPKKDINAEEKDLRAKEFFDNGVNYLKSKNYGKAKEFFQKVVELKPNDALAHYELGLAYGNLGEHSKAIEAFSKTIELKPDSPGSYNNIGCSYEKLGKHNEAIKAFEEYIKLRPKDEAAIYKLGLAYNSIGSKGQAMKQYIELKKHNPQMAKKLLEFINKSKP